MNRNKRKKTSEGKGCSRRKKKKGTEQSLAEQIPWINCHTTFTWRQVKSFQEGQEITLEMERKKGTLQKITAKYETRRKLSDNAFYFWVIPGNLSHIRIKIKQNMKIPNKRYIEAIST